MESLQIPDDYAFLRVGGRTYTISEVGIPSVDALVENIQNTHARRVEALTRELRTDYVNEAFRLSHEEAQRIRREADSTQISVPSTRFGLPLVVLNNEVRPVRSVLYAPNKFSATLVGWRHYVPHDHDLWNIIRDKLGYDMEEIRENTSGHTLTIIGTPRIQNACVMAFTLVDGRILCSMAHMHTTGDVYTSADNTIIWRKFCTGNTPANDYWRMPYNDFTLAVNSVNLDSMATSGVYFNATRFVSVADLCRELSDKTITHVRPNEGWRAEQ
jgi:hypothetical protein